MIVVITFMYWEPNAILAFWSFQFTVVRQDINIYFFYLVLKVIIQNTKDNVRVTVCLLSFFYHPPLHLLDTDHYVLTAVSLCGELTHSLSLLSPSELLFTSFSHPVNICFYLLNYSA